MPRLSDRTLARAAPGTARPAYDRSRLAAGIVHLGVGAFHRAHQAVSTEAAIAAGDLAWGTVGISLRGAETRDALAPQDGLYTLAVRDGSGERRQIVGNLARLLVAPEDPEAVLGALADPAVRIVTLTVTEKGYCYRPASAELDEAHPDIRHDLANPEAPRTVPGFLAEAIRRRRRDGLAPVTLLSCDNLPANGETLARVVRRFAHLRDPDLGAYVAGEIRCPSTMVDRITPATTDADRASIEAATGLRDAWPVVTEPFSQWVIEDRFPRGRPDWSLGPGTTFVPDVTAFELMKLRLLNGSHSSLAYLGYLAGHETVSDAMGAPGFEPFVDGLMREEAAPTLEPLPGFDLGRYQEELKERFRNPALRHRTWQIAMDGSQKIPQRILGTVRDRLAAGRPFDRLALGIAAWMRYAAGRDEAGGAIDVRDPMAARIQAAVAGLRSAEAIVDSYLGFTDIFGTDLPQHEGFRSAVLHGLRHLLADGAARTVAAGAAEARAG